MKWTWIVLLVSACNTSEAQRISRIDNEELVELLKNPKVQLVDVRTPKEVSNGIIENATIIDFYDPEFEAKIKKLDRAKPVAVYCAVGGRSAKAGERLSKLGFENIYDLKAGFRGWKSEGFPVVKQ